MIAKYHTFIESLIKSRAKNVKELHEAGEIDAAERSEILLNDLEKELEAYENLMGAG